MDADQAPQARASPELAAYVAAAPPASRHRLETVIALVRVELPDATERISYGMPSWHQGETVIHVAGYARHVGIYPGAEAMATFAEAFRPYPTSTGTVQFPHDRDLPLDLIRMVVRWRLDRAVAATASRRRAVPDTLRDPGPLAFRATLHRSDASGAACFVDFPWDLKATYGKGNLVPVHVTWDGRVEYRGVLAKMGGDCATLICRKDVVAALGKGPGDAVDVEVTLDLAPRDVEAPEALAAAIDATAGGREAWDALSPSCRREYATWIDEAKREATRDARVAKAVPMILARKRLKG